MNFLDSIELDPKTKSKLQADSDKFTAKGTKLIHSRETRADVREALRGGRPVEKIGANTAEIVRRIDQASRQSGVETHDLVKMNAGLDIVRQLAEIGELSGNTPKLSEDEIMTAYSIAVNNYLAGEINDGRIDPDKLRQDMAASFQNYTPEQNQQVEEQIQKISGIAMGDSK